MDEYSNVLGINFNNTTIDKASKLIMEMINQEGFHYVFTPNSEIAMVSYKDKQLLSIINSANLITADGIGIVYASKINGSPLSERVAGFDLVNKVMEKLAQKKGTIYLFGSAVGVADEAKEKIEKIYNGIKVVGTHNGYFDEFEEKNILNDINQKSPDLLLVCLGFPKQERWIYNNKSNLAAKVAMGLGGTLDVFAGRTERAPKIFIKLGLEWFYRLLKQPTRIGRMMSLPLFIMVVIKNKIFKSTEEK